MELYCLFQALNTTKLWLIEAKELVVEVDAQYIKGILNVTNFIRPYLHQFFDDSHSLNGYGKPLKPLKRTSDQYQSRLEKISIG